MVSQVRQYRKRMISSIPTLSYLDDRPVFALERICAEAWAKGGLEAEKAARKEYKDAEEAGLIAVYSVYFHTHAGVRLGSGLEAGLN